MTMPPQVPNMQPLTEWQQEQATRPHLAGVALAQPSSRVKAYLLHIFIAWLGAVVFGAVFVWSFWAKLQKGEMNPTFAEFILVAGYVCWVVCIYYVPGWQGHYIGSGKAPMRIVRLETGQPAKWAFVGRQLLRSLAAGCTACLIEIYTYKSMKGGTSRSWVDKIAGVAVIDTSTLGQQANAAAANAGQNRPPTSTVMGAQANPYDVVEETVARDASAFGSAQMAQQQPTTQPSQPVQQSFSQPVQQPASQPVQQSFSQPVQQSSNQPVQQPTSQPESTPADSSPSEPEATTAATFSEPTFESTQTGNSAETGRTEESPAQPDDTKTDNTQRDEHENDTKVEGSSVGKSVPEIDGMITSSPFSSPVVSEDESPAQTDQDSNGNTDSDAENEETESLETSDGQDVDDSDEADAAEVSAQVKQPADDQDSKDQAQADTSGDSEPSESPAEEVASQDEATADSVSEDEAMSATVAAVDPNAAQTPVATPEALSQAVTLSLSTGAEYRVASVAIVGRQPGPHANYPGAELILLADDTGSVSANHFACGVDDGGFWATDLGSANGLRLRQPDGTWRPLPSGQKIYLQLNSLVQCGNHSWLVKAAL